MKKLTITTFAMIAVLAGSLFWTPACSDGDTNNGTGEDPEAAARRREILANIGESVVLSAYVEFEQKATDLESATATYAASLDDADRDSAREAWRDAMEVWQKAELYQIGPAGVMGNVAGGEDLRDQIYSWPIVNPCRVDQELVDKGYTNPETFAEQPVNVRGLDTMEYLLFNEGTENACAPNSSINTDGSWDGLNAEELKKRRAKYAETLGADLASRATALHDAWATDGDDFLAEFAQAGAESETYETTQDALNAISDAMFYLDKETKDMKLAQPVGLADCAEDVCPEERESPWADASLAHVRNNLVGFQRLFYGGAPDDAEADGFDDLLREKGADALAEDMGKRIDDALTAVDAVEGTMVEALQSDPESVVNVYEKVKAITDLFKSQFFDVLDLEVPKRGEGDND